MIYIDLTILCDYLNKINVHLCIFININVHICNSKQGTMKGINTTADYINFDTALNTAKKLKGTKNEILGLFIIVGIYTGLRVSDILNLEWSSFDSDTLIVIEGKTTKRREITLNAEVLSYVSSIRASREGKCFISQKNSVFTIQQLNRKLKVVFAKEKGNISCHSLRKTFGRHIYNMNNQTENSLVLLSSILNHSSVGLTRIYLGIKQEEISNIYLSM